MADKENRTIESSRGGGIFNNLSTRIKLIMRLMSDGRINPVLKLLPIGALVYLVVPLDAMFGPVDDAMIIWLGTTLFVELCPQHIVDEHVKALQSTVPGAWKESGVGQRDPLANDEDIVDAEFWEEK